MKTIIGMLLLLVCARSYAESQMREANLKDHLFAKLDQIVKNLPFANLETCGHVLGIKFLTAGQPGSNKYFNFYITETSHDLMLSEAELRANFQNLKSGQLINLDLRKPQLISKKDFDGHFGLSGVAMGFSSLHDPSQRTYVVYKLKGKTIEVRISFADPTETEVCSISIDSITDK